MEADHVRICLFGNFGNPNLGNDATLQAISERLRLLLPDCELCCICSNPSKVTTDHGMDAVPHTVRWRRIWDRRIPLGRRVPAAVFGVSEELREYVRAWRTLKGAQMLVVPGTGLVTDAFGLSGWGPYGLLKWSLVARLRGCKVAVLSVGAGPIDSAVGRRVVKVALSLAHYRSYRDHASKVVVEAAGVRAERDQVFPDLAFGLSPSASEPSPEPKLRPIVALGLMEYAESYSDAGPMRDTYGRYLDSLALFVRWLLHQDYDVKLVLGDDDTAAVADFMNALRRHAGSYHEARVVYRPVRSVQQLFAEISEADAVVATRFHNVLMSLLLEKPVIAISFHHKCSSLMREMGLSSYSQEMGELDADALIARFQVLTQNATDITRLVAQRIEEARGELNRQYELVFHAGEEQPALQSSAIAT
jgi:polysaccharide pyruvyl transferase WcaK-like protein